jgi:hypothetical protein
MSETYYIKRGKKYVPVGISGPDLYDGLWLVQCSDRGRSYKNLYMRLANLPDCHDLTILAKAAMLEDIIAKTMMDAWKDGPSRSIQDVAGMIAAKLVTKEEKLTQKQLRMGP